MRNKIFMKRILFCSMMLAVFLFSGASVFLQPACAGQGRAALKVKGAAAPTGKTSEYAQASSSGSFTWDNAWMDPVTAYANSTDSVFYYISVSYANVSDTLKWVYYRPVLNGTTYLPTGEYLEYSNLTLTRANETVWVADGGLQIEAGSSLAVGSGPYIEGNQAVLYPGPWKISISHNGEVLTTGNFTLIDDLPPAISFLSPRDGTVVQGDTGVALTVSDNLKTTRLDLYADSVNTGESRLLQTYINPPPAPVSFWNVTNYHDGDYILRAEGVDINNNTGTAVVGVIITNKAAPNKQLPVDKTTQVGEPINVANGNVYMEETDILIPGRELPLEVSRTYNSQDNTTASFGIGWRSNYDISLAEDPDLSVSECDGQGVYTIYSPKGGGTYATSHGKYSRLTKNADGTYLIVRKHGRKLLFDRSGKLTRIEERNGNALTIARLANGAISTVTDSAGRKLTFASDSKGRITQVTDPAGRIFKYTYDSIGNLVKVLDPLRKATSYFYDSSRNNLGVKTNANGHSLNFLYDDSDRAYHTWQDGQNNELLLRYDWANKTTQVLDSYGHTTTYQYNVYGLVTKTIDAQGNAESSEWDSDFNLLRRTDKKGSVTDYSYDTRANLVRKVDPLGRTTDIAYEPSFDLVSSVTDAIGGTVYYEYDAKGNLIRLTDALGAITTNTYDALGQLTQTKDANNHTVNYTYDSYGNLAAVTDALNNRISFTYNAFGKVTQERNALGYNTTFAYDQLGRLTQTTYPDAAVTGSTYDGVGNRLTFIDQLKRVTTYSYDTAERLVKTVDALGGNVSSTYDYDGNRLSVIDAKGGATQYTYDTLDRLIKTVDPLGRQYLVTYDANGNIASSTDAKNSVTWYTYDKNNRLLRTAYQDGSSVSYEYDALGRKISMTDATGTTSYTYDAVGRLLSADGPGVNDTVSYTYDNVGNRLQMRDPDGGTTVYAYDALNRLSTVTDPRGMATGYTYDAAGNVITITHPGAIKAAYAYDKLNRVASLVNTNGAATVASYAYVYDAAGMRTKATFANGDYIQYAYDKVNRLLSESRYNQTKAVAYSFAYSYDANGNRVGENVTFSNTSYKLSDYPAAANLAYSYNAGNQLTNLKVYQPSGKKVTLVKEANYSYDANGNLVNQSVGGKVTAYGYDVEDRLVSVTGPSVSASYAYDGEGKRVSQNENSAVTQFVYDGMNVISERNASGQRTASYARSPGYPGGIGGIIASYDASNARKQYLYDGLGSVAQLMNAAGQVGASYTYDAFGNLLQQSGTAGNAYQYQTKQTSSTTGLVYFGARYYNPLVGRWMTQDPAGMIDGPNMYVYLGNNPLNLIDAWGLCGEKAGWDIDAFLSQIEDFSNVMLANPIPDQSLPYGFGLVDQGIGVFGLGVVKATKGIKATRVVIGETSKRVAEAALKSGAEYYLPRKTVAEIGMKRALINNYQWLSRKVKAGYEVIDIGLDEAREGVRGVFYEAERRWLSLWGK